MGRLVLFVSVILLSAATSNAIRIAGTVGARAPSPAVQEVTTPPVATTAAATTSASSEQQSPLDDRYQDSKRKVPNGPDPIHNRRARWGDAPATRV